VLEGINVVQGKNKLVSLCEQELVDCCDACNGAGPGNSWDWLINNTKGFLATEESYPYVGGPFQNRTCAAHAPSTKTTTAKVSSWQLMHQDKSGNQDNLVAEVSTAGPCNIGVDAASCMLGYKGGIITNCTGKDVDHANVVVGYGEGE
jgi:cathepsin F/cysteine peptidase B